MGTEPPSQTAGLAALTMTRMVFTLPHLVGTHFSTFARRDVGRQRKLEHRFAGGTVEHGLPAISQRVNQVAGAGDKAVVPLDPSTGMAMVLPSRNIISSGRSTVRAVQRLMNRIPLSPNDLHPVVVGVVERLDLYIGRVGKVQYSVAARGFELEHDRGRRVQVLGGHDGAAVNPGIDPLHLAHQVAGQGEQVIAMVKDQRTAATLFLVKAPQPRAERHLPGIIARAGVNVQADHLRFTDLPRSIICLARIYGS